MQTLKYIDIDRIVNKYYEHILFEWLVLDARCRFNYLHEACSMEKYAYRVAEEILHRTGLGTEYLDKLVYKVLGIVSSYRAMCKTCKYYVESEQAEKITGIRLPRRKGYCRLHRWTVDETIVCRDYYPVLHV